jgi:micrococcal nuclease
MRRQVGFVVLVGALVAMPAVSCALVQPVPRQSFVGAPTAAGASAVVRVTKVSDGDTVHVLFGRRDERVRLIGVNTPEVSTYGGQGECFGARAAAYTTSRLLGTKVRLQFDVDPRDPYGRLLAYVYLGPELFNLALLRLGYANADPVPPDTRMASTFARAEADARASGVGRWSACPAD